MYSPNWVVSYSGHKANFGIGHCNVIPRLCKCNLLRSTREGPANLQRIQSAGAKLVLQKDKLTSSTECLHTLHWLPIRERIDYKILTLIFKSLNNQAPMYLQDLLCECPKKEKSFHSNSIYRRLVISFTKCKTLAAHSFSVRGPTLWNQLPNNIQMSKYIT